LVGYNQNIGYLVGNFDTYLKDNDKFEEGKNLAGKLISGLSKKLGSDVRKELAEALKESYEKEQRNYQNLVFEGKTQSNPAKFNSGLQMLKDLQYDVQRFTNDARSSYSNLNVYDSFRSDYSWYDIMMQGIRRVLTNPDTVNNNQSGSTNPIPNFVNRNGRGSTVSGLNFTTPGTQTNQQQPQPAGMYNPNQPWGQQSFSNNGMISNNNGGILSPAQRSGRTGNAFPF
jgi:hypothetical protein